MTSNMPLNSNQVLACCQYFSTLKVPILLQKNVGFCIKIKEKSVGLPQGRERPQSWCLSTCFGHIYLQPVRTLRPLF